MSVVWYLVDQVTAMSVVWYLVDQVTAMSACGTWLIR